MLILFSKLSLKFTLARNHRGARICTCARTQNYVQLLVFDAGHELFCNHDVADGRGILRAGYAKRVVAGSMLEAELTGLISAGPVRDLVIPD